MTYEANDKPIYMVKRKNAEIYHTGFDSYVSPRIYVRVGDAKIARDKCNRWYERALNQPTEPSEDLRKYYESDEAWQKELARWTEAHLKNIADGPYVVVIVKPQVIEEVV